jgi:DNA-binding HxlR family transcriptional regulator
VRCQNQCVRSYSQYCGLAAALDVVGDRWTLLIVRELLIRQPCRYTDLAYGLPGIATNLLADRLRQLEEHGIVARETAPPPIATTVFTLTRRGEELRTVVEALGQWGRPLLAEPIGDAEFRSHWLALPLERRLVDATPEAPPVAVEIHTADRWATSPTWPSTKSGAPSPSSSPTASSSGRSVPWTSRPAAMCGAGSWSRSPTR